jgi:hypothetical protein
MRKAWRAMEKGNYAPFGKPFWSIGKTGAIGPRANACD